MHCIIRIQRLPITIDKAWDFFSSHENLNEITPPDMNFQTLGNSNTDKMYSGQIITYKVSPLFGIPLYWMTEITHVREKEYFVDEQRKGPYTFWHHTHRFSEIPGGVEIYDQVYYELPFGLLGILVHKLVVKKRIAEVFDYRFKVLEKSLVSCNSLTSA